MKRLATLLLAAGLVFGISTGASAVDFKAKGQWVMSFDYGQNGAFQNGRRGKTGWGDSKNQDEFEALQRLRLTLEAVASENLSGTVQFEIGEQFWGKGGDTNGGALGADGKSVIKVKHAYLDWIIPQTDAKVRMGIQPMALPSYTTGSQIFNDDTAGVQVSYQFNDMVGLTAFWARPYNDNYGDKTIEGRSANRTGFMDNVDMFGLSLPIAMDGVKVNPFFMIGAIGPNAIITNDNVNGGKRSFDYNYTGTAAGDSRAGMFPVGGARDKYGDKYNKGLNTYGTAWWAGITADITVADPFRFAFDFNYGSVTYSGNERLKRAGWLLSALAEYKMDWGTPGIVGWYTSGDDKNPKNGSERMPVLGNNTTNNDFSNFAFNGAPYLAERESLIGKTMVGTWGIGLRLKDMSFVEDLKHTFRVNYIGGTNSPAMIKRYAGGPNSRASFLKQNQRGLGNEGLYMTTMDQAVEFGLQNTYKIYENLTACLDINYLLTSLDRNRIYVENGNGKRASVSDPWNVNLTFMYSF